MLNILSFDCAIKRLGVCYIRSNTNVCGDINTELKCVANNGDPVTHYNNIVSLVNNANTILWMDNIDLTPGEKVGDVDQLRLAEALHATLSDIDKIVTDCDVVLIECQPNGLNNRSSIICGQLVYHYVNQKKLGKCSAVYIVPSTWKNKISLGENLDIKTFKKRNYASNYTCNKAHSRENFKHWTRVFEYDLKRVKKPLTDIADAFMQALAWVRFHKFN